ncbi:GAP family protein [Microbacterium sp. M]|uniref:GAP family protein n=1 Tax=Microbacterium sp. M TaxID=3377125 RepID=UPI00386C0E76
MTELVFSLIPVALGVVLSPLAIMALVAVLLSQHARSNGIAYLLGWIIGLAGLTTLCLWLFDVFEVHALAEPPIWVPVLRIIIGVFLFAAAVWVYRKGRAHIIQMSKATTPQEVAAASPQLPGWLQAVSRFRPGRTFLLGIGLFVLNPVDASCAIIAALDISLSGLDATAQVLFALGFIVVGTLPIALPVLYVLARGENAQPLLDRVRTWIAGNTHVLNAALLLVIGAIQLQKGISGLL